ncbi:trefoil factor 2-like [Budorcas taxicolor]|uniref:trefoil factor 2-like n=1 Tax=Budorcas taxicolor TaxID=37181 RepID=UPI0022848601|nr:trefoil factor 2-like [Budorcas taxicolor]
MNVNMGPRGTWLLAMLLLLGLCALAGAQKPGACQCSRLNPRNRVNCGFPGISSDNCFSRGCCFDSSVVGVPWCFNPLPKQESEECVMEVSARKDCGYPGISPEECESRKCCFSDTIPQVPWCFFPISVEEALTTLLGSAGSLLMVQKGRLGAEGLKKEERPQPNLTSTVTTMVTSSVPPTGHRGIRGLQ